MKKFNILKGIPANLPMMNVDTDMIIPKQFLKTIKRTGLGKSLFFEIRYDEDGKKIDKFVLNQEPYKRCLQGLHLHPLCPFSPLFPLKGHRRHQGGPR